MTLRAIPYYGGKAVSGTGAGAWIAGLLPAGNAYCEPFAGMLGVMLQRLPCAYEIANDSDGRILAWWTAVRDMPNDLARLVAATPYSDTEFRRQWARLDDPDPLRRALAVHVVLTGNLRPGLGNGTAYRRQWDPRKAHDFKDGCTFGSLSDRMRNVRLYSMDACDMLDRIAPHAEEYVVYCDPPYRDADTSVYGVDDVDRDRLASILGAWQGGAVAISGYGSEWDCLGWHRAEKAAYSKSLGNLHAPRPERTEVLWMNYSPQEAAGPLYA